MAFQMPAVWQSVLVMAGTLFVAGAIERQGMTAMDISLVCQGLGVILMGVLAAWITNLAISKFNWNKILAVAAAVLVSIVIGGALSFLSLIISIPVAGIR
ncbi:MAG: hypothetical protein AB1649_16705 [Chloroflexota bacterium]